MSSGLHCFRSFMSMAIPGLTDCFLYNQSQKLVGDLGQLGTHVIFPGSWLLALEPLLGAVDLRDSR